MERVDITKKEGYELVQAFIKLLKTTIKKEYNIVLDAKKDFTVLEACRTGKISFHVIIQNKIFYTCYLLPALHTYTLYTFCPAYFFCLVLLGLPLHYYPLQILAKFHESTTPPTITLSKSLPKRARILHAQRISPSCITLAQRNQRTPLKEFFFIWINYSEIYRRVIYLNNN